MGVLVLQQEEQIGKDQGEDPNTEEQALQQQQQQQQEVPLQVGILPFVEGVGGTRKADARGCSGHTRT
jgi:hypothetical protein